MFGFHLILLSLIYLNNASLASQISFKLELLQVMSRHGDRIPVQSEMYKNDPYHDLFLELGIGELTSAGKRRQFKVGQVIREHYNDFLGDYNFHDVYAYSTDIDRTKMSLELVLAGLYPPTSRTKWNDKVLWTPTPFKYNLTQNDIFHSFMSCGRFNSSIIDASNTDEYKEIEEKYQSFIHYLQEVTGEYSMDLLTIMKISNNLKSVLSLGLPLPTWCTQEIYETLEQVMRAWEKVMIYTPDFVKLIVGPIIDKFLYNIDVQESGRDRTKIHIYSNHDLNVGPFINFHNFTNSENILGFGTTVIVEKLRGSDNQIYLRMYMWTGVTEKWIPLEYQHGKREYLLSDYIKITKWVLPKDGTTECFSPQLRFIN